jgi:retron-type reverse transcriptase
VLILHQTVASPVEKESGELVHKQRRGTPQGGVISPLLANLFLHYAMDKWLETVREQFPGLFYHWQIGLC